MMKTSRPWTRINKKQATFVSKSVYNSVKHLSDKGIEVDFTDMDCIKKHLTDLQIVEWMEAYQILYSPKGFFDGNDTIFKLYKEYKNYLHTDVVSDEDSIKEFRDALNYFKTDLKGYVNDGARGMRLMKAEMVGTNMLLYPTDTFYSYFYNTHKITGNAIYGKDFNNVISMHAWIALYENGNAVTDFEIEKVIIPSVRKFLYEAVELN